MSINVRISTTGEAMNGMPAGTIVFSGEFEGRMFSGNVYGNSDGDTVSVHAITWPATCRDEFSVISTNPAPIANTEAAVLAYLAAEVTGWFTGSDEIVLPEFEINIDGE